MIRRKAMLLAGAFLLAGCTHTHLTCPLDGVQTAVIGGGNLTTMIAALAPLAVSLAPLLAKNAPATPAGPHNNGFAIPTPTPTPIPEGVVDNYSLDIFGTTYVSCGNQPPPQTKN